MNLMICILEPCYVPYLLRSVASPIQGNGYIITAIRGYEQRSSLIPILTINFDPGPLN